MKIAFIIPAPARRWLRYRRILAASVSEVLDLGYRVSPEHYARLRREARESALRA